MKENSARRAAFARWFADQLTARGYDVSSPRSGGRARFAADSGISAPTVGRLLRGDVATDIRTFAALAEALRIPLGEVLVRAGILTPSDLEAVQNPNPHGPSITPREAAAALGIEDEQAQRLFVSMVETLRQKPPNAKGGDAPH